MMERNLRAARRIFRLEFVGVWGRPAWDSPSETKLLGSRYTREALPDSEGSGEAGASGRCWAVFGLRAASLR